MFAALVASGVWGLSSGVDQSKQQDGLAKPEKEVERNMTGEPARILPNLALSQLILVMLTLTTAHVQIISRISSAYPVWLWYAAASFHERNTSLVGIFVRFMVMYAIIQGGLFASFLPPA